MRSARATVSHAGVRARRFISSAGSTLQPMRIAAIDIGTNSVHMIVVRVRPDLSFEVIDREKEMVRLGAGGLDGRALTPTAQTAALQALSKFRRMAESHGVDEIIAAATSAVREADERRRVPRGRSARRSASGARVISGTEEARLIHMAAVYGVDIGRRRAVVIDIGGGSIEITLGTGRALRTGAQLQARRDPADRALRHDAIRSAGRDERQARRAHPRARPPATSRRSSTRGLRPRHRHVGHDPRARRARAPTAHGRPERRAQPARERRRPAAAPQRASSAPARGAPASSRAWIRAAPISPSPAPCCSTRSCAGLGAEEITLCDFALREGLVLDYIRRNTAHIRTVDRYPDVRRRSVIELGRALQLLAGARAAGGAAVARALRRTRAAAQPRPAASASGSSTRRCSTTSARTSATSATTSTRTT